MNQDPALRVLLGLILACLALLVAQGFGLVGDAGSLGRYRISVVKSKKPWLMRVDSVTGQVERLKMQGGDQAWETLGLEVVDLREDLEPEPAEEPTGEPPRAAVTPPPTPPAPKQGDAEIDSLVESLQPSYPREIRVWAAELLGTYTVEAPETSVPALIGALDDSDTAVVVAAARSLGRSQRPQAVEALRGLQNHPDPEVRAAARKAVAASQ